MKSGFIVIIWAFLAVLFMSFNTQDGYNIVVYNYNSNLIRVNEKPIEIGMKMLSNSKISFPHDPNAKVILINKGKTIPCKCKTGCKAKWETGRYMEMYGENFEPIEFKWWIKQHFTSGKGADFVFQDVEYMIGDARPFVVKDPIQNNNEQYFKFIVIEGKYKGKSFIAYPDSEINTVRWITRDLIEKNGIKLNNDKEALMFNVIYHNWGKDIRFKDKVKFIFIK